MSKKSQVALVLFNLMAIAAYVYSIWAIHEFALVWFKKNYMGFGVDLSALTLVTLSAFESNDWQWLYLVPVGSLALLVASFFTKVRVGLQITVLFLATSSLMLVWFALLEPMLR